jgi:hypothetical protein
MPGLPDATEKEALAGKMNSYGKTWHVWIVKLAKPLGCSPERASPCAGCRKLCHRVH